MSMRRSLAALLLPAVLFAGCSAPEPTSAAPGDGPAASEPSGPVEGEQTEDTSDASATVTGSFDEKLVYPDGVAVEVIRVKQTKLSDVGSSDAKTGTPIQVLSIRVTNGSKAVLDVAGASGTMTYGPDGEEAPAAFDTGIESMDGKVLPGKAKTGTYGWAVPAKYLGDVQLEFLFDYDHGSAIFTGRLK